MEIRARPSSLAAMPRRAIRVISSRMRWKDHFSISSFSLADLGGQKDCDAYIAFLPCREHFVLIHVGEKRGIGNATDPYPIVARSSDASDYGVRHLHGSKCARIVARGERAEVKALDCSRLVRDYPYFSFAAHGLGARVACVKALQQGKIPRPSDHEGPDENLPSHVLG
jgi:hypothetical protein